MTPIIPEAEPIVESGATGSSENEFALMLARVRACAVCRDAPRFGPMLPHAPRPVVQADPRARLCIVGQAPGARAHASGRPFTDPSGDRLRAWIGVNEGAFYDARNVAIVGMGFCFPGTDASGGDLPPRRECASTWHDALLALLPRIELMLLIGHYAQRWHLGPGLTQSGVTATMRQWRSVYQADSPRRLMPLPHPSWRNSGWLKRHPWFEAELLPVLRADVQNLLR